VLFNLLKHSANLVQKSVEKFSDVYFCLVMLLQSEISVNENSRVCILISLLAGTVIISYYYLSYYAINAVIVCLQCLQRYDSAGY